MQEKKPMLLKILNKLKTKSNKTYKNTKAVSLYENKLNHLFNLANVYALNTPQMGYKLAGNCTTVSYGMLNAAKKTLGQDVQLVIGYVNIKGKDYFNFSDNELKKWRKGKKIDKYGLHCWLATETDVIDLTLAATIHEEDGGMIPENITYINLVKAKQFGITYHPKLIGAHELHKLGLCRS